jgi:RNA ligase (TIGR02306 family)
MKHYITNHKEERLYVIEGENVADFLEIDKFSPVIPTSMSGEVFNLGYAPVKFDLEPIEKNPDLFRVGEPVDITEKLHGTFFGVTILTDDGSGVDIEDAFVGPLGRNVVVYSKGLGQKGLVFKDNEQNAHNLYVMAWKKLDTPKFWDWYNDLIRGGEHTCDAIHILGEVYGQGVQDLTYGSDKKELRIFAIGNTMDNETLWACQDSVTDHCETMGAERVPLLWSGGYSSEIVVEHRDGKTTLGGQHIREGVVVYSHGRVDPEFGNVKLKAVSPKYKLRKGGTEFN